MGSILARLTRAAAGTAADARLLDAFLSGRDEQAFRGLVERHGPMVFGVCLRVLRHRQDAEDAFQATFVVLARRAADVWPRSVVGSWLYGVAYRVALKARSVRARRLGREQPLGETDVAVVAGEPPAPDLRDAIDRAISKLPEVYRAAVVACDLEGRSRREAAEQLGWKEGTLSGRLARARQILAERLRRTGLSLPAGGVAVALRGGEAAPAVGSEVIEGTVRVATGALAAGVPAAVAVLTEGVVPSMVLVKLKTAAVAVLASCAIGYGVWASAGTSDGPGTGAGDNAAGNGSAAPPQKKAEDRSSAKAPSDAGKSGLPADMPIELLVLQGRWAMIHETMDPPPERAVGSAVPAGAMRVLISGDRMIASREADVPAEVTRTLTIRVGPLKPLPGGVTVAEIDLTRDDGTRLLGLMALPVPKKGSPYPVLLCFASQRGVEKAGERPKDFKMEPGRIVYTLVPLPGSGERREQEFFNWLQASRDLIAAEHQLNDAQRRLAEAQSAMPALRERRDQLALFLRKAAEAREQAKPETNKVPAPAGQPDDRMRAEAERQRDQARSVMAENERLRRELDDWKAKAARLDVDTKRLDDRVRGLQTDIAALQERLKAAEAKAAAKAGPPVQTVAVTDENGKNLPIPEALRARIEEKAIAVFLNSGGELTATAGGPPFANADRWTRAEKAAHVKVWFPEKRRWSGNTLVGNAGVSHILIPMTDRQAPDYLLIHDGDTYRAFFNLPEDTVKELQKLLAEVKK